MAIVYDCLVKNGTYKDKNTGEERNNWLKVGVVVETKNGGLATKIECLPPLFDGWIQLAKPKPKDKSSQETTQSISQDTTKDEDIPF